MYLVRIDPKKPDPSALKYAADVLKRGGLVVYPTETAYALGCDAANPKAVRRIFSVKKRDASKPLPLIAASKRQVIKFCRPSKNFPFEKLAEKFWPGPLTMVLASKNDVDHFFAGGKKRYGRSGGEIAVRVSPHPVASALAKALGRPVVSTSANLSGGKTRYRVTDILKDLGILPDLVLDAGPLPKRKPSTIVRCEGETCEILREGAISPAEIRRQLSTVNC